ncbi:O-antigen ligase family protein [Sanguibacter suarezii]|uniref:O-antigen ligase family protein n=1 Tax=Sanguibacter suarezii TaxID=60921 RepID=UPI0014704C93|nr:O-antigen ligase family protein [Sanguibacter suarezii]
MLIDVRRVRWSAPPWTILLFLGICAASVLWSVGPSDTERSVGLYGAIALFACLVVANTETPALLRGVIWGALIVAGIALWAVWTERIGAGGPIGVNPVVGVHGNRNVLSYTLFIGLCAVLCYRPRGRLKLLRLIVVFSVVLGTLVAARSGTGFVSAAVVIVGAIAFEFVRRLNPFATVRSRVIGCSLVAAAFLVSLASFGTISELLGKTGDFSGRMPVWSAIVEVWSDAPVGGYGWGAIWPYSWFHPQVTPQKWNIDQKAGLWYAHGHNSVFDLLPQLGVVGVVAFVLIVAVAVRWVLVSLDAVEFSTVRWIAVGILGFVVYSITEPMLAVPVGWFLLVILAADAQRLAHSRRLAR